MTLIKYFSFLGDSITTFGGYIPQGHPTFYGLENREYTGVFSADETWWGRVLLHFGAELLVNDSWSGSYVCRSPFAEIESHACSMERTSNLGRDGISPDHIIIFMGTNDRGHGFRLVSSDKGDLTVIENAYRLMLERIRRNYPDAVIWCCTFPKAACSLEPGFEFPRMHRMGIPMSDYGDLIRRVAGDCGCRVIELFDEASPIDTVDGLHPNYDGMKAIAQKVISAMEGFV